MENFQESESGSGHLQGVPRFSAWWTLLIDNFHFFCSGEGKGEAEAPGGIGLRSARPATE